MFRSFAFIHLPTMPSCRDKIKAPIFAAGTYLIRLLNPFSREVLAKVRGQVIYWHIGSWPNSSISAIRWDEWLSGSASGQGARKF